MNPPFDSGEQYIEFLFVFVEYYPENGWNFDFEIEQFTSGTKNHKNEIWEEKVNREILVKMMMMNKNKTSIKNVKKKNILFTVY